CSARPWPAGGRRPDPVTQPRAILAAPACRPPTLRRTTMDDNPPQLARRMWTLFEPVHVVTYFTPEARSAFEDAGLRGFWLGYFAGRAAPLGAAAAAPVTGSFFSFAPSMVARALPGVWDLIAPADALAVRS